MAKNRNWRAEEGNVNEIEYAKRLEDAGYDTPERLWRLLLSSDWHCNAFGDCRCTNEVIIDDRALLKAAIERLIKMEKAK